MLLCFTLVPISLLIWQSMLVTNDSTSNLNYFYDYMDNTNLLRTAQGGLANLAMYESDY